MLPQIAHETCVACLHLRAPQALTESIELEFQAGTVVMVWGWVIIGMSKPGVLLLGPRPTENSESVNSIYNFFVI